MTPIVDGSAIAHFYNSAAIQARHSVVPHSNRSVHHGTADRRSRDTIILLRLHVPPR